MFNREFWQKTYDVIRQATNTKSVLTIAESQQQTTALNIDQSFQQAIEHHQAGRLQDAERLYRAILQVRPDHIDANLNLEALVMQNKLVALFTEGHFTEAAALAQTMTERFPLNGFGWMMSGMLFRRMAQSADALAYAQKGAALSPNYAAAHYNLGNILVELGRLDEAEASFRQALRAKPDYTEAHNNLGCILKNLHRLEEAEVCYRRTLQLKPDFAEAYNNLGVILNDMGRINEAEACYQRALQLKPDYAEAHNNLGLSLHKLCRLTEAEANFRRALQLKPDCAEMYGNLGGVLKDQGRLDESLACLQQQTMLAPGNSTAQHLIASMTGTNTERAPVQYVESVFDGYANNFDTHLQQTLKYEAPERLVEFVVQHLTPTAEKWTVLDLGCGTGLVGMAIAPFTRQLVGVDLSTRMLEKAHTRNVYQRLERLDLLTMMQGEKASYYDAIFAADVFVYLGKLDEIICAIKRLLRPGGVFAFTVEDLVVLRNEEGSQSVQREYQLENTGRYTHSASYLKKLAFDNSFQVKKMVATQIRMEFGEPVNGYLVLWQS
jgi:predicted TPR repeat methyltransferase